MHSLTHGALFNGIAGFPLAAAWAGISTSWTVEIDEFCNKVSKKHFPDAIQYTDIHEARNLSYVDIISGGFPCQPYSVAGKQLGNADDRALWPQMLRIIREVKPAYVIGENVAGLVNMGLDDVLATLENEGYTTETFIIPACGIGAPHRRDRVWIIAYSGSNGTRECREGRSLCNEQRNGKAAQCQRNDQQFRVSPHYKEYVTHSNGQGLEIRERKPGDNGKKQPPFIGSDWRLTEPPVCGTNDGIPAGLVRNRAKQLKAYGNAIVPQVAHQLFEAIKAHYENA